MSNLIKTHVIIPADLLRLIDSICGKRKRSPFLVEAAKEKIAREKFMLAIDKSYGAWSFQKHPQLKTLEDLHQSIRKQREVYKSRLKRYEK